MTYKEFYQKCSSMPISERRTFINFTEFGTLTFQELFRRIKDTEEQIRLLHAKQDELLKEAERYIK